MIIVPRIMLGRGAGTPAMLTANDGYEDDGQPYDLLARTRQIAVAGTSGEAIFTALYLTTTTFADLVTLFVTPSVDGVPLETQQVHLGGVANPNERAVVKELALSVPFLRDGVEVMRTAPRGTWFDVTIETRIGLGNPSSTRQIIEAIEVEYEVVRESMQAV